MSDGKTVIPRSIKGFDLYIRLTYAYLLLGTPTNANRYNWTATYVAQWLAFLNEWTPLYTLYEDKKGGYTTDVKNDLLAIIANAIKYAEENKLIELIRATVGLTSKDCSTWHLPATLALPAGGGHHILTETTETDRTAPTTEAVYAKLISQTGGMVRCKCYTEATETGRPKKLKGFDLIDYAFGVFYSGTANLPMVATDPRLTLAYSTKANFIVQTAGITANLTALAAGAVAPAKVLVIFFRHAKSKHPALDGPWTVAYTIVLL